MSSVIDLAKRRAQCRASRARALQRPIGKAAWHVSHEKVSILARAAYYEERAVEVRAKAESMFNEEVRSAMRRLAAVWDTLARKAKMDMPSAQPSPATQSESSAQSLPNASRNPAVLKFSCLLVQICGALIEPFPILFLA